MTKEPRGFRDQSLNCGARAMSLTSLPCVQARPLHTRPGQCRLRKSSFHIVTRRRRLVSDTQYTGIAKFHGRDRRKFQITRSHRFLIRTVTRIKF